jgi:hypothetical protein
MLTLGDIEFTGFALPENIDLGGEQALVVQKVIGGARVVHAMGPDDAPIEWSGRFLGETAELKAFRLDLMRRKGEELDFRFANRAYRVVIKKFTAKHERPYLVSFSITLEVVKDLMAGSGGKDSNSIEAQIDADLLAAEIYAQGRDAMLFAVGLASTAIRAAMGDKQVYGKRGHPEQEDAPDV